jgi:hypothetical protein
MVHHKTADVEKAETRRRETAADRREEGERLDEALDESFPASDPPSLTQPATKAGAPVGKRSTVR